MTWDVSHSKFWSNQTKKHDSSTLPNCLLYQIPKRCGPEMLGTRTPARPATVFINYTLVYEIWLWEETKYFTFEIYQEINVLTIFGEPRSIAQVVYGIINSIFW